MQTELIPDRSTEQKLPSVVRNFLNLTLLFTGLSALYHLIEKFILHNHGHNVWPFTLNSYEHFRDFYVYADRFQYFHAAGFFDFHNGTWPFVYPAPVAVVCEFFFHFMGRYSTASFVCFCILSFIVPAILFARALRNRGIAVSTAAVFTIIILIFSWPALLIVDGANTEVIVWLALATGMWAYSTGRGWTAAAFFGVGAALKLFPFVYLALFFSTRQYKKLLFGIGVFLLVTVASLAILGPTIPQAAKGILSGLDFFKHVYMEQWRSIENGVDHSLFAAIKFILVWFFHFPMTNLARPLAIYLPVTAVGGLLLYFLWIRRLPLLNQVITLTIASIYFTAFSGDGTLIHLYYGFAMLTFLAIDAHRKGLVIPGLNTAFACLAFLLSTESFFFHHGYRFEGQIKACVLAFLFVIALVRPFGPPVGEDNRDDALANPDSATWADRHS